MSECEKGEPGLKVSPDFIKDNLSREEGRKLGVYNDSLNIPTVGVGHNIQANPTDTIIGRKIRPGDTITEAEADALLKYDVDKTVNKLNSQYPWFKTLPGHQQYVMISMGFNMGLGSVGGKDGLGGFHTMLASLKNCDCSSAQNSMQNSKWAGQVGNRSGKLIKMVCNGKLPETLIALNSSDTATSTKVDGSGNRITGSGESLIQVLARAGSSNIEHDTVEERFGAIFQISQQYIRQGANA